MTLFVSIKNHFVTYYKRYILGCILYVSTIILLLVGWFIERREGMDCGVATQEMMSLIINGSVAPLGFAPWYVALKAKFRRKPYCGGTIISRDWILTAHHCVRDKCPSKGTDCMAIVAGAQDSNDNTGATLHEVIEVKSIDNISIPYTTADIVLLRVSPRFYYRNHGNGNMRGIGPVCLPEENEKASEREAVAVGFGWSSLFHRISPKKLNAVILNMYGIDYCNAVHFKTNITIPQALKLLCVGNFEHAKGACVGDSGGPLTVVRNGKYTLVGVAQSVFNTGCDQGVKYTDVTAHRQWIADSTGV